MNLSRQFEVALKASWIVAGIAKTDAFYNAFQVPELDAKGNVTRRFPQIMYGCGPDVPDGFNSPVFTIPTSVMVITYATDDKVRTIVGNLYEKIRTAINTANSDVSAWTSSYLTGSTQLNAITVEPGTVPYFDDDWSIIELSFSIEACSG